MPRSLAQFGHRGVLIANTIGLGGIMLLFATIGASTPIWVIVLQAMAFGFLSSLQFTAMNTLVYADVSDADTSMASTMASTVVSWSQPRSRGRRSHK